MSGDKLPGNFSLEAVGTWPGVISYKEDDSQAIGKSGENRDDLFPEGKHYTPNSKKLKTHRMQQQIMDSPQKFSCWEERDNNQQVVIQGRGDDVPVFLVNYDDNYYKNHWLQSNLSR